MKNTTNTEDKENVNLVKTEELLQSKEAIKQAKYDKWNKRLAKIADKLALSSMVNFK